MRIIWVLDEVGAYKTIKIQGCINTKTVCFECTGKKSPMLQIQTYIAGLYQQRDNFWSNRADNRDISKTI